MRKWQLVLGACALLTGSACKIDNSSDSDSKGSPGGITGPTTPGGLTVTSIMASPSSLGGNNGTDCTGFTFTYQLNVSAFAGTTSVTVKATDFEFTSSNSNVAGVDDNGKVTLTGNAGTADITVKHKASGIKTLVPVNVTKTACTTGSNDAVTNVIVSPPNKTMSPGEQFQLTVEVMTTGNATKAVTWSSTNMACATVDGNGKVTALQVTTQCQTDVYATSVFDTNKRSFSRITNLPAQTQYGAITINPQNPNLTLSGQGSACQVSQQFTATQLVNNQSVAASGQWNLTGPAGTNPAASTGTSFNFNTNVPGLYSLSLTANGQTGQTQFTVGGSCANGAVTLNPSTANGNPGQTLQINASQNGNSVTANCSWQSSNTNVISVNTNGLITFVNPGTATVTCTLPNGAGSGSGSYTTNQPQSVFTTVTPNNQNLTLVCNNGTGSVQGQAFQALDQNGAVMSGTPTVTLVSGPQGGVSISGATPTYSLAGTYVFNVTLGGVTKQATTTVGGSCTSNQFITITPQNFGTLVVGGAGAQLNVSASGAYTLSVSTPCLQYTQSGNVVTVSAANCAAYQQNGTQSATITASLTGTSLTAQSTGSVTSGTVNCSGTLNGVQIVSGSNMPDLPKGQSEQGFVNCTNQNGVPFTPLIRSSNTNEVRVVGSATVNVGTTPWQIGPSFTLVGDNSAGTNGPARITVQHSLTDTGTILSFFVRVP